MKKLLKALLWIFLIGCASFVLMLIILFALALVNMPIW